MPGVITAGIISSPELRRQPATVTESLTVKAVKSGGPTSNAERVQNMYARMLRYQDAPENQRDRLIPMTVIQYDVWEKNARQARRDYMAGKIEAREFLRRIDTTHELTSYDTLKQELPPEESIWQKRVAADLDFDPAEELIRKDQEGHQSLKDQYSK